MGSMVRILIFAGLLGVAKSAVAVTVFDPANLVQNTMTAMRTLEMLQKQARQLQNQVQMLMYQQRNLVNLPFDVSRRLRSTLDATTQILARAQGLSLDVARLDQEFEQLYPERYAQAMSGNGMLQQARERWLNLRHGLQTALQVQAQVTQNLREDESVIADLLAKSQSATGALQAMQATNQLLALQAAQSIQAQQLQLTHSRAAALELAGQAAAVERGREMSRRFLGTGTPYTPHAVRFYGR
ncbi:P-type conjugative transfer protein TrbJ [Cupriavidus pauculus]|uniref:P-type conjugative transfer protein TrbJ n=2 Tax=Cupriavidus pauculus TaxID=82633 RepID=A0A2N5C706_9BURK|nr:P-type conjugative transfer protein TrbJ [Cupriavidus pauculus]